MREVVVGAISEHDYGQVVALIADYQRFYGVSEPDHDRNEEFFKRFLAPSDAGLLLGARLDRELVGYACLYWTFSSVQAAEVVLLNDLYVVEGRRGSGVGARLIDASLEVARERGASTLEWRTEVGNERAQRLYDRTGATRSQWLEYEIGVEQLNPPPSPRG